MKCPGVHNVLALHDFFSNFFRDLEAWKTHLHAHLSSGDRAGFNIGKWISFWKLVYHDSSIVFFSWKMWKNTFCCENTNTLHIQYKSTITVIHISHSFSPGFIFVLAVPSRTFYEPWHEIFDIHAFCTLDYQPSVSFWEKDQVVAHKKRQ